MDKFYNETLTKLEMAINELEFEADYSIHRIEAVINLVLSLDTGYFQSDLTFYTSQDYKVAKIIANDLIQVY